jgi:hypothetical protein
VQLKNKDQLIVKETSQCGGLGDINFQKIIIANKFDLWTILGSYRKQSYEKMITSC